MICLPKEMLSKIDWAKISFAFSQSKSSFCLARQQNWPKTVTQKAKLLSGMQFRAVFASRIRAISRFAPNPKAKTAQKLPSARNWPKTAKQKAILLPKSKSAFWSETGRQNNWAQTAGQFFDEAKAVFGQFLLLLGKLFARQFSSKSNFWSKTAFAFA